MGYATIGLTLLVVILMSLPGVPSLLSGFPSTASPAGEGTSHLAVQTTLGVASGSWRTFHGDPGLSGVSNDTTISTANSSSIGLDWMVPTGGAIDSSPVVGTDTVTGATLVYIGNTAGGLEAVDASNGTIVWSDNFGVPFLATPSVYNHSVWAGTYVTGRIYKLNGTTGAIECSLPLGTGSLMSSPTIATPPGGRATVYFGIIDNGVVSSGVMAVNESSCRVEWNVDPFINSSESGVWNPASFVINQTGVPVVLVGSANPDSTVYALNADTGATLWTNRNLNPANNDVGSGITVSPPGDNGIAAGMAYYPGEDGRLYAMNLTTGKSVWTFNFKAATTPSAYKGGRSAPALAGRTLVFGTGTGVMAVDALTGTEVWDSAKTIGPDTEIISSPLVTGPPGQQVVVYGDMNGSIKFLNFANGSLLYSFQTHGFVMPSPADAAGRIYIASSDGFLYAFGLQGSRSSSYPSTTISSPASGSSVANPNSASSTQANLPISGTAVGGGTSPRVLVGIQEGGPTGLWWNSATSTWQPGLYWVILTAGTGGTWSVNVPVGRAGAVWEAFAYTVARSGLADPRGTTSAFTVLPVATGPRVHTSAPWAAPKATFDVSGSGFASGESVNVSLSGTHLTTVTANATGSFSNIAVTVPARFSYGVAAVSAVGLTSGSLAVGPIDITSPWTQLGENPDRVGLLANDVVLSSEEVPDKIYRMVADFAFSTGAPILSSPAVALGVAYVGNTAGDVDAVNAVNGARIWQATTGGAVDSSPAIDLSLHVLVVGSSDGKVYAWNSTTGAALWNFSTGGAVVSSPNLVQNVVYVGSDSGHLYALRESTGSLIWKATLSGAVVSSPAVETGKALAIVGDASGTVWALHTTGAHPGSVAWSFRAAGSVNSTPLVSSGVVYISSSDGHEYALIETTGALHWSVSIGAQPSVTSALLGGRLFVGNGAGVLYAINATDGTTLWTYHTPAAVTGVSATDGLVFTESSNGTLSGFRTGGENVWLAQSGAGLAGTPAISDNAVIVGGEDGGLYVYSPYGLPLD